MDGAAQAHPHELAENRRRCWAHDGGNTNNHRCMRTARLEWCGWRYCFRHFWKYKVRGQSSWAHLFSMLRYTEIARHK